MDPKSKKADVRRWDQAIEDAKDTIAKCKRKIESMKVAIEVFEQARDEGASYPGVEQAASHSEGHAAAWTEPVVGHGG